MSGNLIGIADRCHDLRGVVMPKQRLLVIDDDHLFRQFMQNFAEAMEIDAVITDTPDRFKRAYRDFNLTVILTYLFIPECDGFELLE